MKEQEFQERIVNVTFARMRRILEQKGKEYAGDLTVDRLVNFKIVAAEAGIDPLVCWHVYAAKHWLAINNYVRVGEVRSEESIEGRFYALLNYLVLGLAIIVDKGKEADEKRHVEFMAQLEAARELVTNYPELKTGGETTPNWMAGGLAGAGQNAATVPSVPTVPSVETKPKRKGPHHVRKSNGKSARRNS